MEAHHFPNWYVLVLLTSSRLIGEGSNSIYYNSIMGGRELQQRMLYDQGNQCRAKNDDGATTTTGVCLFGGQQHCSTSPRANQVLFKKAGRTGGMVGRHLHKNIRRRRSTFIALLLWQFYPIWNACCAIGSSSLCISNIVTSS